MSIPIVVKMLDPMWSQSLDPGLTKLLGNFLTFKSSFFVQGKYKKKEIIHNKKLIDKKGIFPTGFIPKVRKLMGDYGISGIVVDESGLESSLEYEQGTYKPNELPGIILRPDQKRARDTYMSASWKRGIIKAPTGSGKTVVAGAIIQQFQNSRTLFLCHTITLVNQTFSEFKKFGFNCTIFSGSKKDLSGQVVVSTIQSFSKLDPNEYYNNFDMVIIDEAHHVSSFSGTYSKVLSNLYIQQRVGFTATLPDNDEAKLALEGLIGPVLSELTMEQALNEGIIVMPKVRIVQVPENNKVKQMSGKYSDIYTAGIVESRVRNRLILQTIKTYLDKSLSVLVIVSKIEHGERLLETSKLFGMNGFFVHGSTEGEVREEIRKLLQTKNIKFVIATAVWKEGVNIPSLDVIVNAAGGKSEIATLQAIGRGLRVSPGKTEAILIDFFDTSHRFFIDHFGHRFSLYCEQGWV